LSFIKLRKEFRERVPKGVNVNTAWENAITFRRNLINSRKRKILEMNGAKKLKTSNSSYKIKN
jgi:hypothetical protein